MKPKEIISQKLLRDLLDYTPETGVFLWKVNRTGSAKAGTRAGVKHHTGYRYIKINGERYGEHRLVWVYVYGTIPTEGQIDHKNGVRDDNRLTNIRLASQGYSDNNQNCGISSNNTSGYPGVSYMKDRNKWVARIGLNYTRHLLGYYDTPEEAYEAYVKAKAELHKFNPIQRTT